MHGANTVAKLLNDYPATIFGYAASITTDDLQDNIKGTAEAVAQYKILKLFNVYTEAGRIFNDVISVSKRDVNDGVTTLMEDFLTENKIHSLLRANKIKGLS